MARLGVSEVVGSGRKQETSVSNMIAKNDNVKTARATQSHSEPLSSRSDQLWLMSGS